MITKTFEVRDRATMIPVLATKIEPGCEADRYLLDRCGYCFSKGVIVTRIYGDPICNVWTWEWNDRTMQTAHLYIYQNFDDLESGSVIDVEFILGETTTPKTSERFL